MNSVSLQAVNRARMNFKFLTSRTKFSKNYLMLNFQTGHPIALKIIDARTAPSDFVRRFLPRELEISRLINHENLLRTITDFESSKKYYIVTELARFDLLQYLRLKGDFYSFTLFE